MKGRTLYPKNFWYDDRVQEILQGDDDKAFKVLLFLIFNDNQGLLPIYKIKPLEVCMKLAISKEQYEMYKIQFESLKLFRFIGDYVLVMNDFAYVDYKGQPQVIAAKLEELKRLPSDVMDAIKGLPRDWKGLANAYVISNSKELPVISNSKQEQVTVTPLPAVTVLEAVKKHADPHIQAIIDKYGTVGNKTEKTHKDALRIYSGKKFKRPRNEPVFAEDSE